MNPTTHPVPKSEITPIEGALVTGDLSKLTPDQRLDYYKSICASLGLNPLTKPFQYITLSGRLTLYASRDATDQLRKINGVSIKITARDRLGDIYVVTAQATDKHGRSDESTGAVNLKGLAGEALANAYMKAETKAKRRVTLSVCGLGMLDETEVETIAEARDVTPPKAPQPERTQLREPEQPKPAATQPRPAQAATTLRPADIKDYVVRGGAHRGKTLEKIGFIAAVGYKNWIATEAAKKGTPVPEEIAEACTMIELWEKRKTPQPENKRENGFAREEEPPMPEDQLLI